MTTDLWINQHFNQLNKEPWLANDVGVLLVTSLNWVSFVVVRIAATSVVVQRIWSQAKDCLFLIRSSSIQFCERWVSNNWVLVCTDEPLVVGAHWFAEKSENLAKSWDFSHFS